MTAPRRSGLDAIVGAWWPLAGSWLLMSTELPLLSAVVARLPDPEVHLAAYGSVVFPLALIVEAPVIMLLAASTALVRDHASYAALRRFTHGLSAVLTAIHVLLAFTPLYDEVIVGWMDVPGPVVEPARIGLMIMTPWTWTIASRRFNQGILIRHGWSRSVGSGTLVRLAANVFVLWLGWVLGWGGIVAASGAVASGVTAEAVYAAVRVRPIVRELVRADASDPPLRGNAFLRFYVPLAMTPLITLALGPFMTAAMSRMPHPLTSLAAWPVVHGLVFLLQSPGLALNEVVVARVDRADERSTLRAFAFALGVGTSLLLLAVAVTPLAELWFANLSGLSPGLTDMAVVAILLAAPIPGTRAIQSWYHGSLVHARRTGAITESVVVFVATCGAILAVGVATQRWSGLELTVIAYSVARIVETVWVGVRARGVLAVAG